MVGMKIAIGIETNSIITINSSPLVPNICVTELVTI